MTPIMLDPNLNLPARASAGQDAGQGLHWAGAGFHPPPPSTHSQARGMVDG